MIATVDGYARPARHRRTAGARGFEIARTIFGLTSTGVVVLDDPTLLASARKRRT